MNRGRRRSWSIELIGALILALVPTGGAAAAQGTALRFERAFLLAADGTRSAITGYPSAELMPAIGAEAAFGCEFDAGGLRYPVSCAPLQLVFTQTGPVGDTPSAAIDLYLVSGDDDAGAAAHRRGLFVGSALVPFRSARAVARIDLAGALNRAVPSGRFTLLAFPSGVPGKNRPFALAAPPDALRVFTLPGDRHDYLTRLMQPLWRGMRTFEEAVIFYAEADGDVPRTRLLRPPRRIERVFSYQTGNDYIEGRDWSVDPSGALRTLPGSALPVGKGAELYPQTVGPGMKSKTTLDGRTLAVTESWSYPLTVMVNYTHDEDWSGPVPAVAGHLLPRTLKKLKAREPVAIVFIGDSIASAGRGSATAVKPPYGPTWPELFVDALRARFGGEIRALNRALGSTVSNWGAANAEFLLAPPRPDLVVIAFGMNDQRKTSPARFRANLETMLRKTRESSPEAEFILVSSMVNNPAVGDAQALVEFRAEMQKLAGPGVAIADVTAATQHLLTRKPFIDIAVNNFNHPNDYLLRWYAQVAAELFAEPGPDPSHAPSTFK